MNAIMSTLSSRASQRFGDRTALIIGEEQLSFKQIDELAATFAGGLRKLGVKRGQRVLLHLPNGWEWIVAYYAIARLGAVVVPANFLLSIEEVAYMLTDSEAVAVIAPDERCAALERFDQSRNAHLIGMLREGKQRETKSATDFRTLFDALPVEPVEVDPEELFTIGYTSGTTGQPKGAMLSHRCVFTSTALTATVHGRHPGERVVSALPFPHVYGNVVMNSCFLVGMTLITCERFDPSWALQSIQRHKATLFEGVPTMFYYMLVDPSFLQTDLSSLLHCTVGGQTMPTAKIEEIVAAMGCPLLELWGMTETAGPVISHSPYLPHRHGSVGQPFPGVEAKVVDYENPERLLNTNEPGELLVRGPMIMQGYYRNEQATRDNLLEGGWLRTGDIACIDKQGYIRIVDRLKDMIITAGYKIYPAELEQVLASHPAVAMVAVAPIHDEIKGELAKAFIVLKPGMNASESSILDFCRGQLAAYKVPRCVTFVESLPKTSTGKIMRRELRELRA
ncbi:long-chain acyl-CoA synthetase [Pseudomonas sp. NFACC02]|uniref:class I adenylate-forming enzyme family protein n=1 Tax=Pseudomonas sp. NFACC02 TaxID=1566250 RepID=UPI0008D5C5BF|nr:AMP-binding protein [Pseudomonas sp. NFACC02]SEQ48191.1 long-chain acyl-CoA synthetase [Pseudomonas sp. NFACC02]